MGQQQLLLIVLGVIIVGVAVVVGINLFNANAKEAEIHNLANQNLNYIYMARTYYLKPITAGGGGRSYQGWKNPITGGTTTEPSGVGSGIGWSYSTTTYQYNFDIFIYGDGSESFTISSYNKSYGNQSNPNGFTIRSQINETEVETFILRNF
jgi:hypothetical protein